VSTKTFFLPDQSSFKQQLQETECLMLSHLLQDTKVKDRKKSVFSLIRFNFIIKQEGCLRCGSVMKLVNCGDKNLDKTEEKVEKGRIPACIHRHYTYRTMCTGGGHVSCVQCVAAILFLSRN
jgi:predicted component of viral defense system (DUF524 family)